MQAFDYIVVLTLNPDHVHPPLCPPILPLLHYSPISNPLARRSLGRPGPDPFRDPLLHH